VDHLKDDNESFRKIVLETTEKILFLYGVADINSRLEIRLMDGLIYSFQEQVSDDTLCVLNAFGTVVNCLGIRTKSYIPEICGTIQFLLNNRSAKVRQSSSDLIMRIASVMKQCGEEGLMGRLGVILYE
jgi:splicing factor 3B subunit 1